MRRTAILKRYHPTLSIEVVRGNVQTRLAKLDAKGEWPQKYDALILAEVGLERMGYPDRISSVLEPDLFPYAVGQGSLGLEIREGDERIRGLVSFLDDVHARAECVAERSFLRSLAGGCRVPVGVHCVSSTDPASGAVTVTLKGRVWATDGSVEYSADASGTPADATTIGETVATAVKAQAGATSTFFAL
jgi:hydroxymethylbilane synthase